MENVQNEYEEETFAEKSEVDGEQYLEITDLPVDTILTEYDDEVTEQSLESCSAVVLPEVCPDNETITKEKEIVSSVEESKELKENKKNLRPRKVVPSVISEENSTKKRPSRRPAKKEVIGLHSVLQNAMERKEKSFESLIQDVKPSPGKSDRKILKNKPPLLTPIKDIKAVLIPEKQPPRLPVENVNHRANKIKNMLSFCDVTVTSTNTTLSKQMKQKSRSKMKADNDSFDGESDMTGSTIDGEISRCSSPGPSILEAVYSRKRRVQEEAEENMKKSRDNVVPSPSLADSTLKAAIPDSAANTAISLCLCQKKPEVFVSSKDNSGDLYCQALDSIDNRVVGCCNSLGTQDIALFRPSKKVSYLMLCSVHQQRLLRHNCCPECGLFCTQGKYLECSSKHQYHHLCQLNNHGQCLCPHCGDEKSTAIVITLRSQKNLIFLPQQKPPRLSKSAKMSVTHGSTLTQDNIKNEDLPPILLPSGLLTLDNKNIDVNGLPDTFDKNKLAHLYNIVCRSFTNLFNHSHNSFRFTFKSLLNSAKNGDVERLLKALACGLNPNHIYEEVGKQTALHVAAANGKLPIIHLLLQAGGQLDMMDSAQNTPLTVAITAKENDVVKYLIKCGASLIIKGEDGMTPLHIAAKNGNIPACHYLLHAAKLPPNYIDTLDDGGWTPLVWASEFNQIDAVRYLLSKGADPFIRDIEQNIALHWATFGGSVDIVDLYLSHGSPINAVNTHGDTPLHIAARQNKYNCVLLLLARGAKSDMRNKNNELAMECAESVESDIYRGISLNVEISSLLTKFHEKTPKILSNDISRGKERNQIQCVNSVDSIDEPNDYIYITENCFTSNIYIDRTITSLQSCQCADNCNKSTCNCGNISIKCWYDGDGKLSPDFNYVDPPMIFECNPACTCNRITCHNRVVQNGVTCRFQLFRTSGRGWGVKTVNLIPKGTYVCEYIGEIISDCEADHREDDSYLFDLDNRDGETYCIDARRYGNIARFINHMCCPNIMPVHVFIDHQDLHFPRIAFFANRDIQPDEELGYDYGAKFWIIKWKSFTCTCTAEKCFYSDKMIKTTLDNYKKKLDEVS